jgi:non-canonical poly(A) RNA polymerase PAPD5/7
MSIAASHTNPNTNTNSGLLAIPLVKHHLDDTPSLRPLILVVKNLLARHGLNSAATGGLSSYSVIWMCVSFLQVCAVFLFSFCRYAR